MSEFDDTTTDGVDDAPVYASEGDRSMLLQEIRVLSGEVKRLRGDTKGLVHEEIQRGRMRRFIAAVIAFALLAIPVATFSVQTRRADADRKDFQQRTLNACIARNQGNANFAKFLDELLRAPHRPGQPPPNPVTLRAFVEFRSTLKGVNCQQLFKGKA